MTDTELQDKIYEQIYDQIVFQIRSQLLSTISNELSHEINTKIISQVGYIWRQVDAQTYTPVRSPNMSQLNNMTDVKINVDILETV